MQKNGLSRRRFLLDGAKVAPGVAIFAASIGHAPALFAADEAKNALDAYQPQFFTNDEWRFLLSASDCLIPADENGPGALGACVPVFIDRQMLTDYGAGGLWYMEGPFHPDAPPELGYQLEYPPRDVYRLGIANVNAHCRSALQKQFHELDRTQRETVLKGLEKGEISLPDIPAAAFFNQLWGNVKEGFFADPQYGGNQGMVGWKMLGFPGARADFMDWIGQHNKPYPFGPVSISGQRG